MKVSVKVEEATSGLVFKTTWHVVKLKIEFSEEELHLIKEHNLRDDVILRCGPDERDGNKFDGIEDMRYIHIHNFAKSRPETVEYAFKRSADAHEFAEVVKAQMPVLKEHIFRHADRGESDETFEL